MEDQAAGDAASVRAQAAKDELEALRYGWGDAYMIGQDDEHGWWAARRDIIGALLTGDGPDELHEAIRADYELRPVPRDCSAPPSKTDP